MIVITKPRLRTLFKTESIKTNTVTGQKHVDVECSEMLLKRFGDNKIALRADINKDFLLSFWPGVCLSTMIGR